MDFTFKTELEQMDYLILQIPPFLDADTQPTSH